MSEMPKQFSREILSHNTDPYAEWSDTRRMEEYAYTGDGSYLTPGLARKMKVSVEAMREVPGVTEEDIAEAEIWSKEPEFGPDAFSDEYELLIHSISDQELSKLPTPAQQLQRLLDVATIPVENEFYYDGYDQVEDRRLAVDAAISKIKNFLIQQDGSVYDLFRSMRHFEAQGTRDVEVMHEVYRRIHNNFVQLAHTPDLVEEQNQEGHNLARTLNEFVVVVRNILASDQVPGNANYLTDKYLENFANSVGFTEDAHVNQDNFLPFEIDKGRLAVFSGDGLRIYILDREYSTEVAEKLNQLRSQITYSEVGQYFARYLKADVPNELWDLINEMIDASFPLEDTSVGEDIDQKQLRDYVSLLRSDIRQVIETEFDFELKDLSIREQFYFLNYLKKVTVANAETMKHFTSLYGVDGMRTFLSLERGDETLGDSIVGFGQHDEVAGTVFKYYGELLNSADRAEVLVREVSDCDGEACVDLAKQVRENILNRAQKDLEKAVRSNDPATVASQIENYVAKAKEYVALLQEIGSGKIEEVAPSELTREEQERMKALLQANYAKAYPESKDDAFKAAVLGSLEKSFNNPDTSFRILRDGDKIVSYNRFDTLRDFTGKEVSYFGSFNADPVYSGVGGVMLEETIKDRLADGRPMMAHCDPTQAITRKYIEDGFIATRYYELAGKPSFEIWRTNESSNSVESKKVSIQDLLDKSESSNSITVREQSESEEYPELQEGKALTRYFTHEGKTYLVFETLSDTLRKVFTPPQEEKKEAA